MSDQFTVPYSKESEYSALASVLLDNSKIHEMMSLVSPDDFYGHTSSLIYEAMCKMTQRGIDIDVLSLSEQFKDDDKPELDIHELSKVEDYIPTSTALPHHCRKIKDLSLKRAFIDKMEKMLSKAHDINDDVSTLFNEAQGETLDLLSQAEDNKSNIDVYTPAMMAELGFNNAKKLFDDPVGNAGYQTGFPETDKIIRRLKDVNIIAASTGVGKTGLAVNIAVNLGVKKVPVLYLNLEMNIDEITTRILSILSGVEMDCIDSGIYKQPEDFRLVAKFAEKLEESSLYMTDNKPKTISALTSLIHKYHAKNDIKVVVVDYIGHIRNDKLAYKENSKRISLGRYNQALKQICTMLDIKLIVVAQMNREGEETPSLFNIGECWQLAQDADVFMILHFEWVKNTDAEADPSLPAQYKDYLLTIAKNRNGPSPRTVKLNYNERTQLMTEREL